ncbi:MAG: sulfite exporter TauE/SafE family protein [Thermomicrobiales bacterium]|nr:sulfite exporter TauE/SafE family protein [Thermomicrobiales bacterium]
MPRFFVAGKRPSALLASLIAVMLFLGIAAGRAAAHPLGNFTVNQYARIEVTAAGPRIVYILDLAEVPALQEIQRIDANGDGTVDAAESAAYLTETVPFIARGLVFAVDHETLTLRATESTVTFPDGQAGLDLLRLRAVFVPMAPHLLTGGAQQISLVNTYRTDRLGWREIAVTHGAGVTLSGVPVSERDASRELTAYPDDLLSSPLDQTGIAFGVQLTPGSPEANGYADFAAGGEIAASATTSRPNSGSTGGRFAALLEGDDLTTGGVILSLLLAMVWGAAHALSPGHGKTVVGAYLVGSRGTPRHAAFLGLTVTITHTAGVIALGLITLFASRYILPETLFPWLSVISGALVVAMGLWTLRMRLRGERGLGHHRHDHPHDHPHDHDHDHDHQHADGHVHSHDGHTHSHLPPAEIGWRGLLALGISGGLIPCPSALLVLLGAVALGRVCFGLALVVAFSLGLAATLTSLGVLFLYAGRLLDRRMAPGGRLRLALRVAPLAGSVVLTVAGVAIVVRALGETSLR